MTIKSRLVIWASILMLIFIISTGCSPKEPLLDGRNYVKQAFDSVSLYSRHRFTFNLDSLETQILYRITDSTSQTEIIQLMEEAIKIIDRHNYILSSNKYFQMETGTNPEVLMNPYPFQHKILQNKYAFLSLDGFIGVDSTSAKNYADSLQRSIHRLYNQHPKGWIIDLRQNTGGWIYPMLAGLGPILGPGIKSYEIFGDSVLNEYYYYKNTSEMLLLTDSIWFVDQHLPIAILIGEETGSAGELLTLSFRGHPKTALIGKYTEGVSTGLHGFFMPDSSYICVTNCIMTDRNKSGDGGKIKPDIFVNDPIRMFEEAYYWIESNGIDSM